MPLFYQRSINHSTKIGVWHIAESENFFLQKVPLSNIITHSHKRLQHLAGRYLLQQLVPGFPYHLIEIADTRKPFLQNELYHFSIAHCGDYAAVIISNDIRVGVDIEMTSIKVEKIKHKFLNHQELALHTEASKKLLTLFWCVKEAVYKWHGNGEVDFRKHMNITGKVIGEDAGSVACEFLKEQHAFLLVDYVFFGEICLAWVVQ